MLLDSLSTVARFFGGPEKHPNCPDGAQSASEQSGHSSRNGGGSFTRGGVKTVDPNTTTWATTRKPSAMQQLTEEEAQLVKIDDAEEEARKAAEHGATYSFVVSTVASLKVFLTHLVTVNSIFGVLLTIGATLWVWYTTENSQSQFLGAMDFALLGFAVVLPLSAIVRFAFVRRDAALSYLMDIKSNSMHIYLAHATWDWDDGKGRAKSKKDFLKHSDNVLEELISMADELCRYLTLPTSSHARHKELAKGREEAAIAMKAMYLLFDSIVSTRVTRLTMMVEQLRAEGLAATECSRIRQWERFIVRSIEELRAIKSYRTPLALRAFANIFTLFIPPFFAPSYVQIAYDMNSLAMGICFGVITSLALTALYESVDVLEDPFVASLTLDGIDVHEELSVLHWKTLTNARSVVFPNATPLGEEFAEDGGNNWASCDVLSQSIRSSIRSKRPSIYELQQSGLGNTSRSMRALFASLDKEDGRQDQLRTSERSSRSGDGTERRRSYFVRDIHANSLKASHHGRNPLPRIPSIPGVDDDDDDSHEQKGNSPDNSADEQAPQPESIGGTTGTVSNGFGHSKGAERAETFSASDELDDFFVENGEKERQ